jgi:hypothetical protein
MRTEETMTYPHSEKGSGWRFFAGTMLGLAGIMRIVDAIWAFGAHATLNNVTLKDGILGNTMSTYAWLWLAVGCVLIVSSFLVLARSQFARWVGFIAATVAGVSAMFWMPYYPVWALTYVGLAVLVFYALIKYGSRETV